ncbi:hypothetical protein IWX47DRAFT_391628 [Phyllosticta citricarpa]
MDVTATRVPLVVFRGAVVVSRDARLSPCHSSSTTNSFISDCKSHSSISSCTTSSKPRRRLSTKITAPSFSFFPLLRSFAAPCSFHACLSIHHQLMGSVVCLAIYLSVCFIGSYMCLTVRKQAVVKWTCFNVYPHARTTPPPSPPSSLTTPLHVSCLSSMEKCRPRSVKE